ncbi:uncharacterized protein BDW47DRAFT_104016 [Aspergillus candidus]|uniref:Uncharacterized protein n=1 Tax=Aspergillus candidus TaxID=41067 RepID=A0A2I2FEC0_ASPCN|nr:hypothetical protein BDW47DRAFT_104016 [Aspergillus candidus]PLB38965.1 hypothetical protein BDW47DRAFT_104016 [Aspergillus candidus]
MDQRHPCIRIHIVHLPKPTHSDIFRFLPSMLECPANQISLSNQPCRPTPTPSVKWREKKKSKKVPAWMILQDPSCAAYVSPRPVSSILPMPCQHPLKHPSLTRSIQRISPGGEEKQG